MHVYIYQHICVCVYKFITIYLHIYTHTCDLPSPIFTPQKFSKVSCTVIQYLVHLVTNRLWIFLRDDCGGLRRRALILRHASVKSPIYPQKRPTYCICESAKESDSYFWRATVEGCDGGLWLWGMLPPRIWRQHDTPPLPFRLAASFARFLVLQTP